MIENQSQEISNSWSINEGSASSAFFWSHRRVTEPSFLTVTQRHLCHTSLLCCLGFVTGKHSLRSPLQLDEWKWGKWYRATFQSPLLCGWRLCQKLSLVGWEVCIQSWPHSLALAWDFGSLTICSLSLRGRNMVTLWFLVLLLEGKVKRANISRGWFLLLTKGCLSTGQEPSAV